MLIIAQWIPAFAGMTDVNLQYLPKFIIKGQNLFGKDKRIIFFFIFLIILLTNQKVLITLKITKMLQFLC